MFGKDIVAATSERQSTSVKVRSVTKSWLLKRDANELFTDTGVK